MNNFTLLPSLNTNDFQIPFPFKEDTKFEDFIMEYFNNLYDTKSFDKFGRSGQKQSGLDVFSKEKNTIIQCKLKLMSRSDAVIRKELIDELDKDFNAFRKYNNNKGKLGFTKFIFASTFKNDTYIHEECIKRCKNGIEVEYWSWERIIAQATQEINQKYFPLFAEEIANYYFENSNIINDLEIDKSKPILEQLFQYFKIALKEVDYLPNNILANQYPFKIDDRHQSYYKKFNLTTNNNAIFDFLASLNVNNDKIEYENKLFTKGVANFQSKTKTVLNRLTSNLVYRVYSDEKNAGVETKYFVNSKCECVKCKLNRLEFDSGFPLLKQRTKSIKAKLKMAYMNYQYGNFIEAAKLFFEISESAKNEFRVIHFICNYNLFKLRNFIRNSYWVNSNNDELLFKIEKIDLETLANKAKNTKDKDLINWIKNNTSYSDARDKIQITTSKIIDHYYSQLYGGWSSGSEVYELINSFAEIDLFLNNNFIVYDSFTGFTELTKTFTEGLMASLAMNSSQEGRLISFDNWIIQKLIFYGHAESILKFFNRYNLKEISYKTTNNDNDVNGFIKLIVNFFNQDVESNFNKYFEENNRFFWSKYNAIFENILLLASLCNISKKDINQISKLLIAFVTKDDRIYLDKLKKVSFFIKRKGEYIDKENLHGFLIASLENKRLHDEGVFEAIADVLEKQDLTINLSDEHYKIIELMCFEKCPTCGLQHSPITSLYIYQITKNISVKGRLKKKIEALLNTKFNDDLFYLATIFNVISLNDQWLDKFITMSLPSSNKSSFRELFGGKKGEIDSEINRLLNLCFKLQLDLSDSRFNSFKKINNYYDWLFNMGNFNYELFNPNWVQEYPTKYFHKEFRKYDIIKAKLVEYLQASNDPIFSRVFVNIYYRNVKSK